MSLAIGTLSPTSPLAALGGVLRRVVVPPVASLVHGWHAQRDTVSQWWHADGEFAVSAPAMVHGQAPVPIRTRPRH